MFDYIIHSLIVFKLLASLLDFYIKLPSVQTRVQKITNLIFCFVISFISLA